MMTLTANDPITASPEFTDQFALFPSGFGGEASAQIPPPPRINREQMAAFFNAQSENARSGHFFAPTPEPPQQAPEQDLAAGVLKQAARDLRRFRTATKGVKRELYLDAYSWINAYDFSWPYSFVNVCKALRLCPEAMRSELLTDASLGWLDYWSQRAGRVSRKMRASFARVFANSGNPDTAEATQLA